MSKEYYIIKLWKKQFSIKEIAEIFNTSQSEVNGIITTELNELVKQNPKRKIND